MRSFPIRKSSTRRVTPQIDSCSAIRVDSLWLARLAHRVVPRDVFVKGTGSEAWLGFCPRTARGVADFFSPVAGLSLSPYRWRSRMKIPTGQGTRLRFAYPPLPSSSRAVLLARQHGKPSSVDVRALKPWIWLNSSFFKLWNLSYSSN